MQTSTSSRAELDTRPATGRSEATVVAAAAAVAVLTWLGAHAAGLDLTVRSGSGQSTVTLPAVAVTAVLVTVAGIGLLRLLERRTMRALGAWTAVAVAVWAVSFTGPLSATTASAGAVLATLHLLVGAVVLGGVRRTRVA